MIVNFFQSRFQSIKLKFAEDWVTIIIFFSSSPRVRSEIFNKFAFQWAIWIKYEPRESEQSSLAWEKILWSVVQRAIFEINVLGSFTFDVTWDKQSEDWRVWREFKEFIALLLASYCTIYVIKFNSTLQAPQTMPNDRKNVRRKSLKLRFNLFLVLTFFFIFRNKNLIAIRGRMDDDQIFTKCGDDADFFTKHFRLFCNKIN